MSPLRYRIWHVVQHVIAWSFVLAVALFISWAAEVTHVR